jgi:hypothetical protein
MKVVVTVKRISALGHETTLALQAADLPTSLKHDQVSARAEHAARYVLGVITADNSEPTRARPGAKR